MNTAFTGKSSRLYPLLPVLLIVMLFPSCRFIRTDRVRSSISVSTSLSALDGAWFITGMEGCENLYLDPDTRRVYVSSLHGSLHLLDGAAGEPLRVVRTLSTGGYALGIDAGPDGYLYAALSGFRTNDDWTKTGGGVARIDRELSGYAMLTGNYPSINGLAFDEDGNCWFTSSNFNFLFPSGKVFRMKVSPEATEPEPVVTGVGLVNGIVRGGAGGKLYVADTLETVEALDPRSGSRTLVYRKTSFTEAFDDLCVDSRGRLWMSDPMKRSLKLYDPSNDSLARIAVEGFGQASSCRIRIEDGREILYVTELVAPEKGKDNAFNGRGVLRVPVASFDALIAGTNR